jgi:nickel transport protein
MVLVTTQSAHAHKVNIFAYVGNNTVFTESYFNDGKKCIHSTVTVLDKQGNKLLEGKTDKKGLFSFQIPQRTDLRIVLTASMGHRAEYVIKKNELSSSVDDTAPNTPDSAHSWAMDQRERQGSTVHVDTVKLRSLIEASLDKKLAPIKRIIEKNQRDHGASVTEVLGGIGYIFGIMGLVIFLKNKKNK